MIPAKGKLYGEEEREVLLARLEDEINETRVRAPLRSETVIAALDALGRHIENGQFDAQLAALGLSRRTDAVRTATAMLRRENLEYRLHMELGMHLGSEYPLTPPNGSARRICRAVPLGTVLHIAAGNADGLPVLSLAEGLLTGNINLLKLPQADGGLSVEAVRCMLEIEPELADYIYIFDTPSSDVVTLQRLAALCDGIITWGGDAAIEAVRRFAPVGAKLIEWGHRLSFAYISGYEDEQLELRALAEHIIQTKQLLCSSCQTIFLDTEDMEQVYAFCEKFLPYLEEASRRFPQEGIEETAEQTLRRYLDEMVQAIQGRAADTRVYRGEFCRLEACLDDNLVLSGLFGNCLVKRLPAARMLPVLRREKGRLQTAGLICAPERRLALAQRLMCCGLVRITRAGDMSESLCGEAHDGEYPLRRYVRIVEVEP